MADTGSEEDVKLHIVKSANWGRPMAHGVALGLSAVVIVLAYLTVSLHPFIWAFLVVVLVLAGYSIVQRSHALGPESVTVTIDEVIVEKGGDEKVYALGPSTKVHLDTELREMGQRYGPLKEISFASRRNGDSLITKDNGWSQEQVDELFNALLPFLEPRDIKMSIRFKRYLSEIGG
jgi:hypothetical protein